MSRARADDMGVPIHPGSSGYPSTLPCIGRRPAPFMQTQCSPREPEKEAPWRVVRGARYPCQADLDERFGARAARRPEREQGRQPRRARTRSGTAVKCQEARTQAMNLSLRAGAWPTCSGIPPTGEPARARRRSRASGARNARPPRAQERCRQQAPAGEEGHALRAWWRGGLTVRRVCLKPPPLRAARPPNCRCRSVSSADQTGALQPGTTGERVR
jgi:hypothetical protein